MEAIVFIGIQGAGKSTYYQRHFFNTHVRLNLDMLKTRRRLDLLLDACLAGKQRFVLDNTHVAKAERGPYIQRAKDAGFRVVGYFFEPEVDRSLRWNAARSGKAVVPVKGVLGTLKRLQRPDLREGFDELFVVQLDEAGDAVVEPYSPKA